VSLIYQLMYRVGFTPWDTGEIPSELKDLVEGGDALPHGQALDLGCGTGTQSLYMAGHGWQVTGIDNVERPLRRARARSRAAGSSVNWVKGDVTRLGDLAVHGGYTLVLDRGCYHGLPETGRDGYARGVSEVTAPGGLLLLMCFAPNRVVAGPRGATRDEIARRFSPAWDVAGDVADSGPPPGGPLRDVARTWYRLRRR
jgi:SAM-dependent methyltransferase